MFVKMNDNKYIPIVEAGSNNCYEYTLNGRQRRERDWQQWRIKGRENEFAFTREEIMQAVENIIESEKADRVGTPRPDYENNPGNYTAEEIEKRFGYFTGIAINGGHCNKTTAQQFRNFFLKGFEQSVSTTDKYFQLNMSCCVKYPNYERRTANSEEEFINAYNELKQLGYVWIGFGYTSEMLWDEHRARTIKKAPQEHTTGYVVNYRCCYGSCFVLKMSSRRLWHATCLERAKIYTTRAAAEKAAQRINQCYETIQDTAIVYAVEKGEYGWQLAA